MASPHRHDDRLLPKIPERPFERFLALQEAFEKHRGWLEDRSPLRFAAVTLLTTAEDPAVLAARVRDRDLLLAKKLGWLKQIPASVRLLVSAALEKHEDSSDEFVAEFERVRTLFRTQRMRRDQVYEALAVLVLRTNNDGEAISEAMVERMAAIHRQMARYHWWLTGPDDFPTAAMLVKAEGTPKEIGAGVEGIYRALRKQLWRGDALQTASNILYLTGMEPTEVADRASQLIAALREAGVRIGTDQYDELAMLCFMALPAKLVAQRVVDYEQRIKEMKNAPFWAERFNLATSIAFLELLRREDGVSMLAEVKNLLEMQQIIAAQQAAIVAIAAS